MYQLRVASVRDGLHPSEVIVTLDTDQGQVNLAIDRASLTDNLIVVGYPVAKRDGQVLAELPRETTSGLWRVWVEKTAVRVAVA